MTNFSGENLNAACGGPQGGGMDSRRNGVAEVSPNYLAEMASNSIPVGYKQTEVGVIPEDWDVCELQDAVNFLDGLRRPVKSGDRAKISGIYPYYGASGIVDYVNDYIFDDELILLGEDGENILSRNLPLAFKVSGKIWFNNHAHVMKPNEYFDITYLTEFLESLDYSLLNSGTAQPKLNKQAYLRINVAKPPRNEQTAIANALSDVDALISELEKLIAKKQAIKTATMQQLLTGRTRLPQFALREDGTPKSTKPSELGEIPEDWEVDLLRSVCDSFKTGKLDANAMKPDGEYRFYTCAKEYYYIDRYAFDEEALMVSGNGANVGYVHYYKGKFNAYQRTYVLSNFIADVIYLKIYLERKLAERIRVEVNAGNTPYITMDTLTDMPIVLPPKEEQTAIATILSDMDEEIQALEQRLSKTRQIKQGMMQELLTGKTRLPIT